MRVCVVKLASELSYSILINDRLVIHRKLKSLVELHELLFRQKLDSIHFLVQGLPVSIKTNDSFKLSSLNLHGNDVPIVIRDKDQIFFSELGTLVAANEVLVHSYTDYIEHKFRDDGAIIVVDKYLSDYCVIYLDDGVIKDFSKVSSVNLPRKIGKFKELYSCPVLSIYTKTDVLGIASSMTNYKSVNREFLFTLDHIHYCLTATGRTVLSSSVSFNKLVSDAKDAVSDKLEKESSDIIESNFEGLDDSEFGFDTEDDSDEMDSKVSELVEQFTPDKKGKARSRKSSRKAELDIEKRESSDNIADTFVSVAIAILFCIAVIGIVSSVVYKGKVDLLSKQIN
ncbi:MAG: hypothetical protein ACRC5M_05235, partial [Anaeroplasmataceae bacterium]